MVAIREMNKTTHSFCFCLILECMLDFFHKMRNRRAGKRLGFSLEHIDMNVELPGAMSSR